MSYEECAKHECESTNGCPKCEEETVEAGLEEARKADLLDAKAIGPLVERARQAHIGYQMEADARADIEALAILVERYQGIWARLGAKIELNEPPGDMVKSPEMFLRGMVKVPDMADLAAVEAFIKENAEGEDKDKALAAVQAEVERRAAHPLVLGACVAEVERLARLADDALELQDEGAKSHLVDLMRVGRALWGEDGMRAHMKEGKASVSDMVECIDELRQDAPAAPCPSTFASHACHHYKDHTHHHGWGPYEWDDQGRQVSGPKPEEWERR